MSKYLDMLPSNCKDHVEGVSRAVIIEDMLKHGTMFAEMEYSPDINKCIFALRDSVSDILESLYKKDSRIVIWNKSLGREAALFGFNRDNEKVAMMFSMNISGFKQEFLEKVINVKGGNEMAKMCPKTGKYVLYLDCKECENRSECEER